jgi:hypothetical protein
MPTIKIDRFGGIAPRLHPTLLGDYGAQRAINCVLKNGKLYPMNLSAQVTNMRIRMENGLARMSDSKSLHLWHRGSIREMLAWPGFVRVAGSNLALDPRHRVFVSGETGIGGSGKNHPCVYIVPSTGDGIIRRSIVKSVLPAPVVTLTPPEESDNLRYTVFFQSWVDDLGYESGASAPSSELTYIDGQTVTVGYVAAPSVQATKRRIWKVVSGSESESIQFVSEQSKVGNGFPQYSFRLLDEDAGEVLPMLVGPHEDLQWISKVPGGFYAGFQRSNLREVRFSEVSNPTSWPDAYTASVYDDIVGLGVTLNTVFVLTTGMPWAVTGTAPDGMSSSVMASAQGCVSARSICVSDGAVFYASADGICVLRDGSASAEVVTEKLFSRRDWQALGPGNCIMEAHDGRLMCWFGVGKQALSIDLRDESGAAVTTHDESALAVYSDVITDNLYYVKAV